MVKNFDDIVEKARTTKRGLTIAVSAGDDRKTLEVVNEILKLDLCKVILVGDEGRIKQNCSTDNVDISRVVIIDEKDPAKAALEAVKQVKADKAQVLVKGNINSNDFLKPVLSKEFGLRTNRKLSVLACYEVPGEKKLLFISDGGMIIAPTIEDKIDIIHNAVPVLHSMGIGNPKVAILAANEKVITHMVSTVDAYEICMMAQEGNLPRAIYEGPIAFDVAMRPEAAIAKGIKSRVSGDVDLFVVPNIEAGNCLGKAIGYFGKGTMAGLVLGATNPIVMSSRSGAIKGKLASIAWALLAHPAGKI